MTDKIDDIKKVSAQMIDDAEKRDELIGRNAEAKRILDIIGIAGGYFGQTIGKCVASLLYIEEERDHQIHRKAGKNKTKRLKGDDRWERLRLGRAAFHPLEAEFVYDALGRSFGSEWQSAFTATELVSISFETFVQKALALKLPWPKEKLPPSVSLELLQFSKVETLLSICAFDPNGERLGAPQDSLNQTLVSAGDDPIHEMGSSYALQVKGLDKKAEQLFIFEVASEAVKFPDELQQYAGFPVRLIKPKAKNITIKDANDDPFRVIDIAGQFSFFALTVPRDWNLAARADLDLKAERWTVRELEQFTRFLRKLMQEHPEQIRLASYRYEVK